MSKKKERMRSLVEEGRMAFIIKEGLLNIGVKLSLLYILLTWIFRYNFHITGFVFPGEPYRHFLYLIICLVVGIYWGFIWYSVHSNDLKREKQTAERKAANMKKKR
ncbi:hypothetical protein LGQ02_05650 [Bacillus shivajii]|uniref:hypothetical protein n=1 Tax=Bacillus shivajii TaxID=1983719 RepID=UPI001CFA79A4|nr:hypothetical protein [Bacillus shivajii]UCZ54247.1 hypothetical protein LGQ02_05650 [Bacillus shivajii]